MKKTFLIWITSLLPLCLQAAPAFDATIPVLDLNDYFNPDRHEHFIEQLSSALKEVGFFALQNAGVDVELLDQAYLAAGEYFALDLQTKLQDHYPEMNAQRGYVPGESAKGQVAQDAKEFYHVGREFPLEAPYYNVWPTYFDLQTPLTALFQALEKCKIPIEQAIAEAIGQPKDFFTEMTATGACLLRAIHYPSNPPADQIWAAAHTDINLFTILPRATAAGLQVLNKQGEWIDISVPYDAFIINAGDMLQNITNGEFRSGLHRVIDTEGDQERLSMVIFIHPRKDDRLDPLPACIERTGGLPLYANATQWELLAERLADLGLASPELLERLAASGLMERLIEVGRASPDACQALKDAGLASDEVLSYLDELGKKP